MEGDKTRAEIFGENLERILQEKGMSRKEFEVCLNVSQSALALYITGKREPPFDKVFKAAKILNVSIVDLLGDNSSVEENKIFEYRLQRAKNLITIADYIFTEVDDGILLKVFGYKQKLNGKVVFSKWTREVKFDTKEDFIMAVEKAENTAIRWNLTFDTCFKKLFTTPTDQEIKELQEEQELIDAYLKEQYENK